MLAVPHDEYNPSCNQDKHCAIHMVDEPDGVMSCGECFHAFPTWEALIEDVNAVLRDINNRYPDQPFPLAVLGEPQYTCPHCSHDF